MYGRPHLLMSFLLNITILTVLILGQSIQWQQLSGPHGGDIYSIVHDNYGNIYANTIGSPGPFKSTNDGESWFSIKNGLTPGDNGGFHPLNINSNGDLFIGGAHSTAYLCRSTDGGNSWEPLNNLNTNGTSVICISLDSYDNVYVGTGNGIYKSSDNGDNWSQYGMIGSQTEAIAFNDSGHVFAGTSYAVYRSTDDGASWTQLPTGGGARTVAIADNGYIFTGKWEGAGIARSTDNGNSWTYIYPQTVSVYFASTIFFDTNGDIYFPTWGNGVLKSTDNGDTWTEMNNNLGRKCVRTVDKNNSGNFFVGCDYAISKSTDGCASWYSVGLNICGVRKIAMNSNDDIFTVVSGINRSTDGGQTWQTINNGLLNYDVRALAINESTGSIFAGCNDFNQNTGLLFKSTDNGNSWSRSDNGFPGGNTVHTLAVNSLGYVFAFGSGYDKVDFMSTDDGNTWTHIGYNLNFGPGYSDINSIGDIFVSAGNSGLWRLPANDTIWIPASTFPVYEFFIASNDYIYTKEAKSTDSGQTWSTIGNGSYIISFAENSAGHLFFGTNQYGSGVYRSIDYGETWELVNNGLAASIDISALAIDSDDYLYAGIWGKSVFKTTTSTLTGIDNLKFEPINFSLYQNYPNPFNPMTNICYDLPKATRVILKIHNILGQEIKTLVNEYQTAGRKSITWDGRDRNNQKVSSGVYLYRLETPELSKSKKFIIMK